MKKMILMFIVLLLLTFIAVSRFAAISGKEIESISDLVYVLIFSAVFTVLEMMIIYLGIKKLVKLFKKEKHTPEIRNDYKRNRIFNS